MTELTKRSVLSYSPLELKNPINSEKVTQSIIASIRSTDCWPIVANFKSVSIAVPIIVNTGNDDQSVSRILLTQKLTTNLILWSSLVMTMCHASIVAVN